MELLNRVTSCSKFAPKFYSVIQRRMYLRLPRERKMRGIYLADGEKARKGDVLLRQWKLNFHPGLNVSAKQEGLNVVLRSMVDGTVAVSREECHLDFTNPLIEKSYGYKRDLPIHKVTFNVIEHKKVPAFEIVESN